MAKQSNSWTAYIETVRKHKYLPEQLQTEGLEHIINFNQITHAVFNHSIPWIYLADYTTGKYLLVSKSMKLMLGYDLDDFLNEGFEMVFQHYEKKHFQLFNEEIFPDRLKVLKQIPPNEHPNYIFAYNFKYRTKKGEFLNILQRNCFVKSDEYGNPLLSFGVITNVHHYKNDNPVIQVVEKINPEGMSDSMDTIFKKSYFLNKEDQLFTKRERELLQWIADGLTSKEIADTLFISEHTVVAHRRNMMAKSNSNNVTELVSFAIRNQLL